MGQLCLQFVRVRVPIVLGSSKSGLAKEVCIETSLCAGAIDAGLHTLHAEFRQLSGSCINRLLLWFPM